MALFCTTRRNFVMTDSTNYWADLANQQLGRAAEPPEQLPQRIPDGAAPVAPLPAEGDPSHGGGVTLHPRMRLALDELLDSEGAQTHNLAILVGHVRRVPA